MKNSSPNNLAAMPTLHKVHVAFCGDVYRDYGRLKRAERLGTATEPWPVPKTATIGEGVVFYNVDREKAFVAIGEIAGVPEPDGSDAHYHYRAPICNVALLRSPLPRDEAREAFPQWAWLRTTQNITTVPVSVAAGLWRRMVGRTDRAPETASRAKTMFGESLYQQRARAALPILTVLAEQSSKIFYQDLAEQIGISNPRVLNYVLGSVGQTLRELGSKWGEAIPPLECLVINRRQELPGEGVGYFIDKARYHKMSPTQKRQTVDRIHRLIWNYPKWQKVLTALKLERPLAQQAAVIRKAARQQGGGFGDAKVNRLVERAAIHFVQRQLRREGYSVISRERERIGYDLDATDNDVTLHVEVKGVSGTLVEFLVTSGEINKAKNDPDFRLFVVTEARSSPKLHRFNGKEVLAFFELQPTAFRALLK